MHCCTVVASHSVIFTATFKQTCQNERRRGLQKHIGHKKYFKRKRINVCFQELKVIIFKNRNSKNVSENARGREIELENSVRGKD